MMQEYAENAVETSLDFLMKEGNSRKSVEAILIAGNSEHYRTIINDLNKYDIPLRKAEIADNNKNAGRAGSIFWAGARDVYFTALGAIKVIICLKKRVRWQPFKAADSMWWKDSMVRVNPPRSSFC